MESRRWTRFGVLAILLAFALTACDQSTGPTGEFDAGQTAQAMQDMVGAVNADEMSDAMWSLSAASALFGTVQAASLAAEPLNPSVATLRGLAALSAADFFPPELPLGTTYVWSEAEQTYVPSELTGAPVDGIRILYYAVDPITGQPATPLNALGYVDLRELSTASSDRLGVRVVSTSGESDVTLADYYLDVSYALTQSSLALEVASVGFLANGEDRLNFDVVQSMSLSDLELRVTQDYSLDLEGTDRAVSYTATLTGDPQSESGEPATMDAVATITGDGQSVRLEISWAEQTLEGTLSYGNRPVILISGTLEEPVFTDPAGDPLTEEELNALHTVWQAIGDLFDFVEGLFDFAAA